MTDYQFLGYEFHNLSDIAYSRRLQISIEINREIVASRDGKRLFSWSSGGEPITARHLRGFADYLATHIATFGDQP